MPLPRALLSPICREPEVVNEEDLVKEGGSYSWK
jgi:hypothetical protein